MVNPPQKPTVRNNLRPESIFIPRSTIPYITPIIRQPVRFTAKVLHGKIPVVEVFIIRPKEYLAMPPIPLPIPTRNVLTKVSDKPIAIFL